MSAKPKTVAIKSVRIERYEATSKKGTPYRVLNVHNGELTRDFYAADLCSTKIEGLQKALEAFGPQVVGDILIAFANDSKYDTSSGLFTYTAWADEKGKSHDMIEFGGNRYGSGKALKLGLAMKSPTWAEEYKWLTSAPTTPTPKPEAKSKPKKEKVKAATTTPSPQGPTPGSAEWLADKYNWLIANQGHADFAARLAEYNTYNV